MGYGDERVYKRINVIGVSPKSIEDAIQTAINKAGKTVDNLSWFELKEVRGHIDADKKVDEYQVSLDLAFEIK